MSLFSKLFETVGGIAIDAARIQVSQHAAPTSRKKKKECTPCAAFARVDKVKKKFTIQRTPKT